MSRKLTTKELAEQVNLSPIRIVQLIQKGFIEAEKFGRDYIVDAKYIAIILSRPERRGRPKKVA